MQVGDLVKWYGRLAVIVEEGPAASSGMMWLILVDGKISPVFEEDLWAEWCIDCLLYTSPSPRDLSTSRMPSSA